jgi:subtilase family serine protease
LIFSTDSYGDVEESTDDDNTFVVPFGNGDAGIANLTITEVTAPSTASSGEEITVSWNVLNDGDGAAPGIFESGWVDLIVFSTNQIFGDDDDVDIRYNYNYERLEPEDEYSSEALVTLPTGAGGDGYLLIKTDYYNEIAESNEDDADNVYIHPIAITAPNLQVTSFTAFDGSPLPSTVAGSQSIDIRWSVQNVGTEDGVPLRGTTELSTPQTISSEILMTYSCENSLSLKPMGVYRLPPRNPTSSPAQSRSREWPQKAATCS